MNAIRNVCTMMLFVLGLTAHGQSANLNKNFFNVNYVQLPEKPIHEDANRTYSIESVNSELFERVLPRFYFENEIKISGFTKVPTDGFLNVEVQLIDVQITLNEIKSETKVKKDDDGKETRTTYYWSVIEYRTQGKVTITSPDGTINETFSFSSKEEKSSTKSTSYNTAKRFRKTNSLRALTIEYGKEVISNTNKRLGSLFGYPIVDTQNHFWILKSKKHPENQGHNTNFQLLKDALDKMKYDEPISQIQDEVAPAITYFKSVIDKYPGRDRKSRKLKYASYYNLGLLYYYLDKPEKTLEYANMLLDNDKGKGDGKKLISMANALKERFRVNETGTRHFKVITEDKTNYSLAALEETGTEEIPIEENPEYTLSYVIGISGDTIPAYVATNILSKFSSIMTTYVKDFQGKMVERKFNASEVEKVVFGNGEKLHTVAFKDASEMGLGGDKGKVKYAKLIFTASDLKLYLYRNSETVIKRKGEQLGYSTQSAGWVLGFKKRLGNLAKGCPSLKQRVDNKEFSNNSDSLIEFMKAYKECSTE